MTHSLWFFALKISLNFYLFSSSFLSSSASSLLSSSFELLSLAPGASQPIVFCGLGRENWELPLSQSVTTSQILPLLDAVFGE